MSRRKVDGMEQWPMREKQVNAASGFAVVVGMLAVAAVLATVMARAGESPPVIVLASIGEVVVIVVLAGLYVVDPNEARVLQLFGRYVGTVKEAGLSWSSPFYTKRRISLRVRNFETEKI